MKTNSWPESFNTSYRAQTSASECGCVFHACSFYLLLLSVCFLHRERKKNPSRPKTHHRKPPENIHTDYWFDETQSKYRKRLLWSGPTWEKQHGWYSVKSVIMISATHRTEPHQQNAQCSLWKRLLDATTCALMQPKHTKLQVSTPGSRVGSSSGHVTATKVSSQPTHVAATQRHEAGVHTGTSRQKKKEAFCVCVQSETHQLYRSNLATFKKKRKVDRPLICSRLPPSFSLLSHVFQSNLTTLLKKKKDSSCSKPPTLFSECLFFSNVSKYLWGQTRNSPTWQLHTVWITPFIIPPKEIASIYGWYLLKWRHRTHFFFPLQPANVASTWQP